MTDVLLKKNPFFLKAFIFSVSIHFIFLFIFVVTLPAPQIPFKPSFNFLGALFQPKEMFDFITDQPLIGEDKTKLKDVDIVFSNINQRKSYFVVDKPKDVNKGFMNKKLNKTIFPQEPVKENVGEEFSPAEDFSFKPLKLESK